MSTSIRTLFLAWGAVLAVGLSAPSLAPASAATRPPVALGMTINPPMDPTLTNQYIAAAGATPGIEMWFRSFDAPLFYSSELKDVQAIGATPMVTWDPVAAGAVIPFSQIVAGDYDSYLRAQADTAAAAHGLIYIRLAHEMNIQSTATPWGPNANGNTAANYIAAWRHIVTIFRLQGATNVRWVWAPNVDCQGACPFTAYYPGDAWVDDVGLDGYNFAAVHHVAWMSLAQIFASSYRTLTAMTSKPVMFTETASTESGGDKAQWITQAFLDDIPTLFPRVVAVIWWQRQSDGTDWRVNSSPAATAAWRAVVASPYYGGSVTAAPAATPLPAVTTPAPVVPTPLAAVPTPPASPTTAQAPTPLATVTPPPAVVPTQLTPITGASATRPNAPGGPAAAHSTSALLPGVSQASITGIVRRRPRLSYDVDVIQHGPALRVITLALPNRLTFAKIGKGCITVTGANGKRLWFAARRAGGKLTIILREGVPEARIIIPAQSLRRSHARARSTARRRRDTRRGRHASV